MAIVPDGYCEIWNQFSVVGDQQAMYCSLGAKKSGAGALTQSEADGMLETAALALAPLITAEYVIGPGHVIDGGALGDNRIDGEWGTETGDLPGASLPQNCTYLVRKLSGVGGRKNRGRMYIPGVLETEVDKVGKVSAGQTTIGNTQMAALLTTLTALTTIDTLVVLHTAPGDVPTPITSLSFKTTIATQRRRLRP